MFKDAMCETWLPVKIHTQQIGGIISPETQKTAAIWRLCKLISSVKCAAHSSDRESVDQQIVSVYTASTGALDQSGLR